MSDASGIFSERVRFPSVLRRFFYLTTRLSLSLQEQEEIPSSSSHRGKNLGAPQKEGFGGELSAQCDTHARIFLLQESPMHQLRINEVSDRDKQNWVSARENLFK